MWFKFVEFFNWESGCKSKVLRVNLIFGFDSSGIWYIVFLI